MKFLFPFLLLTFISLGIVAQDTNQLYSKAYGESKNPAVIFLHGGPGYNCADFEFTTAQKLANRGYYVIVFDQRGCGRSNKMKGKYTMQEGMDDIKSIYGKYGVKKATLIGHSWGGIIGTKFAENNPAMVNNVLMVGAPVNMPMTFRAIQKHCKDIFLKKKDSVKIAYIDSISKIDSTSMNYCSLTFQKAMDCGLYMPPNITNEARKQYMALNFNPNAQLTTEMDTLPFMGFFTNEHYTMLDITKDVEKAKAEGVKYFGMYGEDDGLFNRAQIVMLRDDLIGNEHFVRVPEASHNVFIDRQSLFLDLFDLFMKGN